MLAGAPTASPSGGDKLAGLGEDFFAGGAERSGIGQVAVDEATAAVAPPYRHRHRVEHLTQTLHLLAGCPRRRLRLGAAMFERGQAATAVHANAHMHATQSPPQAIATITQSTAVASITIGHPFFSLG